MESWVTSDPFRKLFLDQTQVKADENVGRRVNINGGYLKVPTCRSLHAVYYLVSTCRCFHLL